MILKNRILCVLTVFLLITGAANAEFSPAVGIMLDALPDGNQVVLYAGGAFTACGRLSSGSLSVVNSLLSRIKLRFLLGGNPVCVVEQDGKAVSAVPASNGMESTLLTIVRAVCSHPEEIAARAVRGIGEALANWRVADSRSLSIKNAGTAAGRVLYTLSADEWNAALPSVTAILRQAASQVLAGSPGTASTVDMYLSELRAESKGTLKRFVLADGSDLGMEFTGRVSRAGQDIRNVTVYCGYSVDKGIYVSIKCPAVVGRNNFSLLLSGKLLSAESKNTISLSLSVSYATDAEKFNLNGEASVVNRLDGRNEQITGVVTVDITRTRDGITVKSRYTAEPALALTPGLLSGTVLLGIKPEKGLPVYGTVEVSLASGGTTVIPVASGRPISGILIDWLLQLPDDQALLLMHELAGESWMDGETIPQQANDHSWVVETEGVP